MKILDWIIVSIGIMGLVGVRVMEDRLFYDPFLAYFKGNYHSNVFPEFVMSKLILHHLFRFLLNLFFSCVIVHFLFKRIDWTIQALLLITFVFVIAFPLYLYAIHQEFKIGFLFSFYLRRFVIQPLVVLLIIPMFYYRKYLQDNKA